MLTPGKDFKFFNPYGDVQVTRSNLPHWYQDRALYFVTFRQADSIPTEKLNQWKIEYANWLNANPKPWNEQQVAEYEAEFARKIERWLDAGYGSCVLRQLKCREIVANCLTFSEPERYRLDEWVVAPNHAHALVAPQKEFSLTRILQSWKGISARQINEHLGQIGQFWQKESYDHIVRNQSALDRIRRYIRQHKR